MAQGSYQTWIEYHPTYSFQKNYNLGVLAAYKTNLEDPRWHTLEFDFMSHKKLSKNFDVMVSANYVETKQYEEISTLEIRPALGVIYHFLPGKRVSSGIFFKVEFRNIYAKPTGVWTYDTRPRLRFFGSIPLNKKRMTEDHTLYAASFLEFFFHDDKALEERYSSLSWFRLGLGYKLTKKLKLELMYTRQDSKNTITDKFEDYNKENIFVLTVVHSLN